MLTEFSQDAQFLQQPGGRDRMLLIRIKLASSLRGQRQIRRGQLAARRTPGAQASVPRGALREGHAAGGRSRGRQGKLVCRHQALGRPYKSDGRTRPRPESYYDAWYHVAWGFSKQNNPTKARQALLGVMRLSPNVGGPEMKAKYQGLLARLK